MLISKWVLNNTKISTIILDPMFEKWDLNNAKFGGALIFFYIGNLINKGFFKTDRFLQN